MVKDKFIWCRNCDAVHHVNRFDKAPVYSFVTGAIGEIPTDDWRVFMARHEGHRLEPLSALGDKKFIQGSLLDPMSVSYVEVTNGQEHLLIRQTRKSISEPLSFELIPGQLIDKGFTIGIQEKEIKLELKCHFDWSGTPMSDARIGLFIEILKELVKDIKPAEVEIAGLCFDDANSSFGRLEPQFIELLLTRCARHFSRGELTDLRRFVESHVEGDDVMALILRRQIAVERTAA